MSYYAKMKGEMYLNGNLSKIDEILDRYPGKNDGLSYNAINIGSDNESIRVDIDDYTNFDEDAFIDFFSELNPFTKSGEVRCTGEDDELWRFIFTDGCWDEQSGSISFFESSASIKQQYTATFVYKDESASYIFFDFNEAVSFVRDNISLLKNEREKNGSEVIVRETISNNNYANFEFLSDYEHFSVHVAKVYC